MEVGANGDWLDFRLILDSLGYNGADPFADGWLRTVQSGADTIVQVDSTGGGNEWFDFIVLDDITAGDILPDNWLVM